MAQNYSPEALAKRKAYTKKWAQDNREARKAYNAEWYKNKDLAHHIYNRAKSRATREGVLFDLNREDVVVPVACPCCGIELERGKGVRTDASPSLDKVVPSRGYVTGNVAVICMGCNRRKSEMTLEQVDQLRAYIICASSTGSRAG